jgi:hypothetical protein
VPPLNGHRRLHPGPSIIVYVYPHIQAGAAFCNRMAPFMRPRVIASNLSTYQHNQVAQTLLRRRVHCCWLATGRRLAAGAHAECPAHDKHLCVLQCCKPQRLYSTAQRSARQAGQPRRQTQQPRDFPTHALLISFHDLNTCVHAAMHQTCHDGPAATWRCKAACRIKTTRMRAQLKQCYQAAYAAR